MASCFTTFSNTISMNIHSCWPYKQVAPIPVTKYESAQFNKCCGCLIDTLVANAVGLEAPAEAV